MRISKVMSRNVETVAPEDTLQTAACRMRDLDVGLLPVCRDNRLVGMLSDRDPTVRAVADGRDPAQTPVEAAMTVGVIACRDDQSVEDAAKLMSRHLIRRLMVIDRDDQLVGIVSLGDLAVQQNDESLTAETLEDISEPIHANITKTDDQTPGATTRPPFDENLNPLA